jgi:DNA mismatch repair protein MutL
MKSIIKILPDHVANQIAAGEVIQRPASVVKELMENSVDAGSTIIELLIKDAGKTLIQVMDNGIGMSLEDLNIAFERHATSKIKSAEDLFSITSKGFRGEALASIAAISEIETHSRKADQELANNFRIKGSKVIERTKSSSPFGTLISVKNIFFNIPARRNFLKSENVEFKNIIDEFIRISLAHSKIKFKLIHNKSELFDLPIGRIRDRIISIFGNKIKEHLVPLSENTSVAKLEGFLIKPEFAKKTRGQQFLFVNNRFIKSSFLHHSIVSAFKGLLSDSSHPGYFIFLNIDPAKIDINIHPSKTEIKFEDEQSLYSIIRSSVKHSLGMFQISPSLDFETNSSMDVPYLYKNKNPIYPPIEVDSKFNPFVQDNFTNKNFSIDKWKEVIVENKLLNNFIIKDELKIHSNDNPRLFQLFKKFIVCPLESSLIVVNQKRAHQRVLYERFIESITSTKATSQQLIFPIVIKINSIQKKLYNDRNKILESLGFNIIQVNENELKIDGVPEGYSNELAKKVIENLIDINCLEEESTSLSQGDYIAKSLAKSMSIKTGVVLKNEEQQALLDDLFACKETFISPFNRKIFVILDKEEIEKKIN